MHQITIFTVVLLVILSLSSMPSITFGQQAAVSTQSDDLIEEYIDMENDDSYEYQGKDDGDVYEFTEEDTETYDDNTANSQQAEVRGYEDHSQTVETGAKDQTTTSQGERDTSKDSPFVSLVGNVLYRWSESGQEIHQLSTNDLLKDKDVVAIYFSASWCGPCRQFTPVLAEFYKEMAKKNKKFEVIWVSQDRSTDDFIGYYQHMPWLAVAVENVQQVLQITGPKLKLQGIPHLAILDGFDASVITLDGRTKVLKDKFGLEFPWRPKTLLNLMPRPVRNVIKQQINGFKEKIRGFLNGLLQGVVPKHLLEKVFG